jgi:hypothetical protein
MISFEDFTSFPLGFEIPFEGRVDTCPRCGRNGIEEQPACGNAYFLHSQSSDIRPDGMLIEPVDCCPLPEN